VALRAPSGSSDGVRGARCTKHDYTKHDYAKHVRTTQHRPATAGHPISSWIGRIRP